MAKPPRSYEDLATDVILHSKEKPEYLPQTLEMNIVWKDGVPTLLDVPKNISQNPVKSLQDLLKITLDMPYTGPDKSLQGKSNGEAMILNLVRQAANGSPGARSELLDRFLGSPTQNVHTTTVTGDLTSILEAVAEERRQARTATIIEAETEDEPNTAKAEVDDL